MDFAFCESVASTGRGKWHIRKLTEVGHKPGGGIDTPSLCRHVKTGWDLLVEMTEFHLSKNTCPECLRVYRQLTALQRE